MRKLMPLSAPLWQNTLPEEIPKSACDILSSPASLTAQLRLLSQQKIQHKLHRNEWAEAYEEERQFGLWEVSQSYWVREISWDYQQTPWVTARVVVPEITANLQQGLFTRVGGMPLGDILFQDSSLKRSPYEFCQLSATHPYTRLAEPYHEQRTDVLWARRSLLYFQQQPLFICEVFLPAFFHYVSAQ